MKFLIIFILSFNLFAYNDFFSAMKEPQQIKVKKRTIKFKGFNLTALYKIKMIVRVVSAKKYSWDNLSPIITHDFGVTWGKISKTNIFNLFTWNQKDRFLIYSIREDYLKKIGGNKYVSNHIANIHLIPKNWSIESQLNKVKPYDIIEITGYLVDVQYGNHIVYTSITRTDTGPGACEVIFIENFKILKSRTKNLFYKNPNQEIIDTSNMDFKNPGENTRAAKYRF